MQYHACNADQSKHAQKIVFRFSISNCATCHFLKTISQFVFSKQSHISTVSQKSFSRIVPLSAFIFKFHISPTTRKLLVRLRLLSADGTNLSARGSGYRTSPNLTACLYGPSTPRLTRHSPGRLASPNLTACLQGPFTVCCTRVAHHPSSLREPEVALPRHYRNQYHSSKFSPRIWGGNQSSHQINHISFHFQKSHFISFLKNFISHLKLISNFSSTISQYRVRWHNVSRTCSVSHAQNHAHAIFQNFLQIHFLSKSIFFT